MNGKIIWLSKPIQNARGQYYIVVEFNMLEGELRKATSHLVLSYRNYSNWKDKLKEGNILGGLKFLPGRQGHIDADSPVYLVDGEFVTE